MKRSPRILKTDFTIPMGADSPAVFLPYRVEMETSCAAEPPYQSLKLPQANDWATITAYAREAAKLYARFDEHYHKGRGEPMTQNELRRLKELDDFTMGIFDDIQEAKRSGKRLTVEQQGFLKEFQPGWLVVDGHNQPKWKDNKFVFVEHPETKVADYIKEPSCIPTFKVPSPPAHINL